MYVPHVYYKDNLVFLAPEFVNPNFLKIYPKVVFRYNQGKLAIEGAKRYKLNHNDFQYYAKVVVDNSLPPPFNKVWQLEEISFKG